VRDSWTDIVSLVVACVALVVAAAAAGFAKKQADHTRRQAAPAATATSAGFHTNPA
jgi:hypothetical protein